jgi:hypothetical protein
MKNSKFLKIHLLFICVYNDWVFLPPSLHPLFSPTLSLSPCTPSLPGRDCSALISNFVEERV